jgi:hypothetical protein
MRNCDEDVSIIKICNLARQIARIPGRFDQRKTFQTLCDRMVMPVKDMMLSIAPQAETGITKKDFIAIFKGKTVREV